MHRTRTVTAAAALLVLSLGGLTGCSSSPAEQPQSMATSSEIANGPTSGIRSQAASPQAGTDAAATGQATTAASSAPPEPSGSCANTSAEQAVNENIDRVGPAFPKGNVPDAEWVAIDTETYDPCADLSWVTLTIRGGTASSPSQQMLFHDGEYLGTTTQEDIGFSPATVRLSDSAIQVTYRWAKEGESNAGASGRAVSTYSWNPNTESVDHAGEWPPGIG
ncbi:LppP/LprE family lipoprotein [Kocuria indica]|uniref:LppP/LprE family lipoprotein n=1 Tax=Kocuria marina TaxID=223184 RepID=UPI001EF4AF0D|nr:LppP/LprE family lipoprotein [Kocuria indica]MCG7432682.1 LppP/LprE family lipoprotein [Kocuria indica]